MTTKHAKNAKFRTKNSIQILHCLPDLRGEEVLRRMLNVVGRFARAVKTLKHSSTKFIIIDFRILRGLRVLRGAVYSALSRYNLRALHSNTPLRHHSSLYLSIYIEQRRRMYLPINCFQLRSLASCAALWGGAGGFEERRMGERYKLALPVQLNDGTGIIRDICTSGIKMVHPEHF